MRIKHRRLAPRSLATLAVLTAVAAGCAAPVSTPTGSASTGDARTTRTPRTGIAAGVETASIRLTGRIVAPSNLIAQDGASLIGQDGNSLASLEGASLSPLAPASEMVAAGSLNMVAAGSLNYHLAQTAPLGVSGIEVFLADAAGNPISTIVKSGEGGRFVIPEAPSGKRGVLTARFHTTKGGVGAWKTIVYPGGTVSDFDVTAASTLVVSALNLTPDGAMAGLDTALFAQAIALMGQHEAIAGRIDWSHVDAVQAGLVRVTSGVPEVKEVLRILGTLIVEPNIIPTSAPTQAPIDGRPADPVVGDVGTFAGTGEAGKLDQIGTLATFNGPTGIAFDSAGTLYVADANNGAIRHITPTGGVTTQPIAASAARLPQTFVGLAPADAQGLFVADSGLAAIHFIAAATGMRTVAAGGESRGILDALRGLEATFTAPDAMLKVGDVLYVTDQQTTGEGRIRKLQTAGSNITAVTTLTATFKNPTGLAWDPGSKKLLVADAGDHSLYTLDERGTKMRFAGTGEAGDSDGAVAAGAKLDGPGALAVDATDPAHLKVFVAETDRNRIRVIADSTITLLAGGEAASFANGTGASARFNRPRGLAWRAGVLYVSDYGNNRIRTIKTQ